MCSIHLFFNESLSLNFINNIYILLIVFYFVFLGDWTKSTEPKGNKVDEEADNIETGKEN